MVRLKILLLSSVVFFTGASTASADPGSLIIGALASSAFAASAGGTLLAGVINAAIGLGLQLLTAQKPEVPKPQDVQNVIRQSLPPRTKHYGLKRLGGSLLFIEAKSGAVFQVVAFGSHRFDEVVEWIVDSRHVILDSEGIVTSEPYYDDRVRITFSPGTTTQPAYERLIDKFPEIWTEDHRALGIAHALLETRGVKPDEFGKIYPNRIAVLNGIFRTARVYDPRTETTAYSANLALQLRDYLRSEDGVQIAPSYIDNDDFIQAADLSDVLLPTKSGGTTRRYHGALSYSFDAEPSSVIGRFITATDGRLALKANGKIGFSVGVWQEPTVILTDEHIIDFSMSDSAGPLRESNEIIVKYEEPLADFAASQAQPWRQEDEISEYGEVRSKTIEAYEIQSHNHARRIAKIAAHRGSPRWQGKLKTTLFGMNAWDQRWVRVQIADLDDGIEPFDETMEVVGIELDFETMSVSMQVASFGPEAYEFDPVTEEGTPPALPDRVEEGAIPAVAGATAIGAQRVIAGGLKVPVIKASVPDYPEDQDELTLEVQYSVADEEDWQVAAIAPDALKVDIIGLEDGELYDVRFRWRAASGGVGPFVVVENIPANADPVAPAAPVDVLAPLVGLVVSPSARAANDNTRYLVFKRGTVAQTFAAATQLNSDYIASPNQVIGPLSDSPGYGHWKYWFGSKNGSDVECVSPASVLVDIYGPELITNGGFASASGFTLGPGWTIVGGVASHSGTIGALEWNTPVGVGGEVYEVTFTIKALTSGSFRPRLLGSVIVNGTLRTALGTYTELLTTNATTTVAAIVAASSTTGEVDDWSVRRIG